MLSEIKAIKDVTVYGVNVPNCDGRAGMAVIIPDDTTITNNNTTTTTNTTSCNGITSSNTANLDMIVSQIRSICKLNLPMYSWPLFLRIKPCGSVLLTTSTFKHIKTDLVKEVRYT